jgi:hypothetical protein
MHNRYIPALPPIASWRPQDQSLEWGIDLESRHRSILDLEFLIYLDIQVLSFGFIEV